MKFASMLIAHKRKANLPWQRAILYKQLFDESLEAIEILNKRYASYEFETVTWLLTKGLSKKLKDFGFLITAGKLNFSSKFWVVIALSKYYGFKNARDVLRKHEAYRICWDQRAANRIVGAKINYFL